MPTAQESTQAASRAAEPAEGDVINNRYRVSRKLGSGGMGTVLLVEDNWHGGRQLALKRVRKDRLDPRTITILRNEFLALAPLTHPNLARVYDFEVDLNTQDYFFTSEYVDGAQLLKAARTFQIGKEGDFLRLLEALSQILRALEFIHSRGLVHGDIKPENILISGSLSEIKGAEEERPRVKMIDFGLTKREKEFGGKRIVGTTYYIAPETILGSQVDRRTDLYSLGVVLYHITTRKLPFVGDSNVAVLRGHIEKTPTAPNLVEPAVPEELSRMIMRLMEKQPSSRYSSALEMIEDLNATFATEFPLETPETRLSYIQSGGFVARETEMAEMAALFETIYTVERPGEADEELNLPLEVSPMVVAGELPPPPKGRMILVRGEPGVGKRRLLKEFRRYIQTRGVHYIEIACGEGGDRTRRSFAELIHAQVRVLSARSPEEAPDPARLMAFLEKIETDVSAPLALRPVVEKLAHKVLKSTLQVPLALAFTDFQKADAVLLEFLRALVLEIVSGSLPEAQLMVVATAVDLDQDDPKLRTFLAVDDLRDFIQEVPLSRFGVEDVGKLLAAMFSSSDPSGKGLFNEKLVQLMYEESDGNPGAVAEILELLISSGRLQRNNAGWAFEGAIERETIPGRVRRDLQERINRLDVPARKLAVGLALLGGGGELEVAARLAEIPAGRIIDAILTLKKARIIREEASEGESIRYSFVHQSAQEILYQDILEVSRPAAHNRAGLLLESHLQGTGRKDARRLAFHFLRAGNVEAALRYGMDAASEYAAAYQPRKAIEVYSELSRHTPQLDPQLAWRMDRQMARLHFQVGEYRAASLILQRLATGKPPPGAEDPAGGVAEKERAAIFVELGETLCRLGSFKEGNGAFHEAFRLLKAGGTPVELAAVLLGFAELYHKKSNYAESLRYCERVLSWEKGIQKIELETKLYLLLADNHFRLDNKEIAARYCQKGLELLGSQRRVEHMALTLHYLGKFYTYKGRFQKALKNLLQCAVVNQKMGAIDRQADCLRELGGIYLLLDNPHEAQIQLSHAISIYERTENVAGWVEALNLRGEALRILGRYEDAQKDLQKSIQLNACVGSLQNAAESCLVMAKISLDRGQMKRAEKFLSEAELGKEGQLDDRVPLKVLVLRSSMERLRGQFNPALDLAARAIIAGKEIGNRLRTAPLLDHLVRLYLVLGRFTEARRSLAALSEIGERYGLPVQEGRALLLEGMLLAAEGKPEEAIKLFERALTIFRAERSERDLINLYLECGRLQLESKNLEQAYLLFEEGLYLAKKLDLVYAKCQFYHLMGLLEAALPEGVFARATGYFLSAERYATSVPFPDSLWRIRRDLGKFYMDNTRVPSAERALTQARETQKECLERIPEAFRDNYLAASGDLDLESLHADATGRVEVQVRKDKVKYPERDPEKDEYFGLLGSSTAMRDLYRRLAALPPEQPWVWVWGSPGSGRRVLAGAIHRQSSPEREKMWLYPASGIQLPELEKFLAEMEKTRAASAPMPEKAQSDPALAVPGRFTLVVAEAQQLGPEVQKALLKAVLAEKGRPDGLRVIATLDRPPDGRPEAKAESSPSRKESSTARKAASQPPQEARSIQPELLEPGFPVFRMPPLAERSDDMGLLVDLFLRAGRPGADAAVPRLTPEALDLLRKHCARDQARDLRDLCEKIRRLKLGGGSVDVEGVRTMLTPTLRIARRK